MSLDEDISSSLTVSKTTVKRSTITVTTTATKLVSSNPNRVAIIIMNRGTSDINIDNIEGVVYGNGFVIASSGGNYTAEKYRHGRLVEEQIFGIVSAGTCIAEILEVVKLFNGSVKK